MTVSEPSGAACESLISQQGWSPKASLGVKARGCASHTFSFDCVYDEGTSQREVFESTARPVVERDAAASLWCSSSEKRSNSQTGKLLGVVSFSSLMGFVGLVACSLKNVCHVHLKKERALCVCLVQHQRLSSSLVYRSCLEGYNATIFAYGQTGTGKTYTMDGNARVREERGIIPRSIEQIFAHVSRHASNRTRFLVRASCIQIYQEVVSDLLADGTNAAHCAKAPRAHAARTFSERERERERDTYIYIYIYIYIYSALQLRLCFASSRNKSGPSSCGPLSFCGIFG